MSVPYDAEDAEDWPKTQQGSCKPKYTRPEEYGAMDRSDIRRQIARLEAQLDKLNAYGEDWPDGTILRWEMKFNHKEGYNVIDGRTIYSYAAIRASGRWNTTGPKSPKSYRWDELVTFWADNEVIGSVRWCGKGFPVEGIDRRA